jgi:hypothetical protein
MNQVGANWDNNQMEIAARIRVNQEKLAAELRRRFDFIIWGAGTSGSVVAGRLAANPETQVLLLEAGASDELELVMDPSLWLKALGSEPGLGLHRRAQPLSNGRAIPYSMGKLLGGGSNVPQKADGLSQTTSMTHGGCQHWAVRWYRASSNQQLATGVRLLELRGFSLVHPRRATKSYMSHD